MRVVGSESQLDYSESLGVVYKSVFGGKKPVYGGSPLDNRVVDAFRRTFK